MEFSCPDCSTPHEFPDEEIPDTGLVVACTQCGRHVNLNGSAGSMSGRLDSESVDVRGDLPEPSVSESLSPIKLDNADWQEVQDSRIIKLDSLDSIQSRSKGRSRRTSDDVSTKGLSDGASLGQPFGGEASTRTHQAQEEPESIDLNLSDIGRLEKNKPRHSAAPFSFGQLWALIQDSHQSLADLKRLGFAISGVWCALLAGRLVHWFGTWIRSHVDGIGVLTQWVAGIVTATLLVLVGAVLSIQSYRRLTGRPQFTVKESVDWVKSSLSRVLGVPYLFLGAIGAVIIIQSLLGVIGRIPYLGPIAWGALFSVVVVSGLAAGAIALALFYCLPVYVPLIQGSNQKLMDVARDLYGCVRLGPLRIISGLLAVNAATVLSMALTVWPAFHFAKLIIARVGSKSMGGQLAGLLREAPTVFQDTLATIFGGGFFAIPVETNATHSIGGFLAGLGSLIIPAIAVGILMATAYHAGARLAQTLR